jgi:site-specific DNA-methyltransferase (adenine-specific)
MLKANSIICGRAEEVLPTFPNEVFSCSISSPPFWALRDYGVPGQLGLEPTFEEYIDKLCTIYDEVKRVLRKDGTCWVNLGDTYYSKSAGTGGPSDKQESNAGSRFEQQKYNIEYLEKSLCLIPQRFAIEMVNRGWILRNVIVWHKPNPMPSSAKDRFTVDFEYIYFFVKSKKYWFEPQYEPQLFITGGNTCGAIDKNGKRGWGKIDPNWTPNPLGRNKRCVWTIPTQPYSEAHFATFPEKLVEPMIKAGCPEFVCTKCGKAREKIYELGDIQSTGGGYVLHQGNPNKLTEGKEKTTMIQREHMFKGYTDCGCGADWRPGIVLDMFLWFRHYFTGGRSVAA